MLTVKTIAHLKTIAASINVTVTVEELDGNMSGYYNPFIKNIGLDRFRSSEKDFCHELGHALDHKDGSFSGFYTFTDIFSVSRNWEAEKSADKRGYRICNILFPNEAYIPLTEKHLEGYRKHYASLLGELLEE